MQLQQRPTEINLDAYFERIGYRGDRAPSLKTLQAIQQQHAQAIAFENFNSLLKQPVLLDLASLQQKLVHAGRGGYCFEQNSLLRSVLLAMGFEVRSLAARVLWNVPEGTITARSHMLLQVNIDGSPYIADVGFGGLTVTAPLALIPDVEQQTPHEPFRFIAAAQNYILQVLIKQEWKSLYKFDLQEQQLPDYEVSNWYVSTYPNSLFVNHLIVSKPASDGRFTLQNNQFTEHYLDGRTARRSLSTVAELRTVLEDIFHINLESVPALDQTLQQLIERSA